MFECIALGASPSAVTASCLCHHPAFARLNERQTASLSRRSFIAGAATMGAVACGSPALARIPEAPAGAIAFVNLRIFDGKSEQLRDHFRVIVEGQKIKAVEPADAPLPENMRKIDCGGRTMTPGLIDAHYHIAMASVPMPQLMTADASYIAIAASEEASRLLLRGFTSIRDMAGPSFGLKKAIDSGLVPGPRIWPSGAMISQTSGHGDFRLPYEIPGSPNAPLSRGDVLGAGAIADGATDVLRRAREQLMLGASQLKLAAGGGVASNYDPIDVSQFTEAEFRAAVDAAENWGTYVAVHAYTPRAIKTAIRAGVRCIDHGQLMDEDTAKLMADKGIWLSSQPFVDDGSDSAYAEGSPSRLKQLTMFAGTDTAYGLAKKHGLKTAWGTDILFSAKNAERQGAKLALMARWYAPGEILHMATGVNAELLQMSGPRNPYPAPVGVIEPGAYADLLLVDGDPLAKIDLLSEPDKTLLVIMKDGRFYKNALPA
jgi:imidazolonepropionase-like amidohydrolase